MLKLVDSLRARVPIRRLVLCDTIGCAYPAGIAHLVETLLPAVAGGIELCMHCHNDFGMAVANTLAGIAAGATAVTCTVNGLGERAGNADLAETAAALTFLYQVAHNVDPRGLDALSKLVERCSAIHNSPIKPVTGYNVFRHESGVHVDGMLKEASSYQFLPAAWLGREPEYVLGKHSGSALIRHLRASAGLSNEQAAVAEMVGMVKSVMEERSKLAHYSMFARVEEFQRGALAGVDRQSVIAPMQSAAE
jgi:isopropylmalate/homocitrate/citramalate synthase